MATPTQISVAEYLETSYRPDREYIDGEIRERNVGKYEHGRLQALLAGWFQQQERAWGIQVITEWRTRVAIDRVRIPDLVVTTAGPQPDVLVDAPLLVIEILSPGDSFTDTLERADDYLQMGAASVWVIDPKSRTGRMCQGGAWRASDRLEVPGTAIYVDLPEIFAAMSPPARPVATGR